MRRAILALGAALAGIAGPARADDTRLKSLIEAADKNPNLAQCLKPSEGGGTTCDPVCAQRMQARCGEPTKAPAWVSDSDAVRGALSVPHVDRATWQSQAIGGVVEFLAMRTRAEVIAWLEDLVGKQLCSLNYQAVEVTLDLELALATKPQRWFAESCTILDSDDFGARKANSVLAGMLRTDLRNLPAAAAYTALAKAAGLGTPNATPRDPGLVRAADDLHATFAVIDRIRRGDAPLDIVAGLGHSPELRRECQRHSSPDVVAVECGAVLGGLVVEHFGGVITPDNVAERWPSNIDEVLGHVFGSDKLCAQIVGVFDPKQSTCRRDLGTAPKVVREYLSLFAQDDESYGKYRPRLERIARDMVLLEAKVEAIRRTTPTVTNLADADAAFQELIDAGFALFDRTGDAAKFDNLMKITRDVLKIVGELQAHDYVAAGQDIIHDLVAFEAEFKVWFPNRQFRFPEPLKQLLTFTVDVAAAKSSDDVASAIDGIAAPVGGWRIKQEHVAFSVTGLVGGMAGHEWPIQGEIPLGTPGRAPAGNAAGVFAPVGLDLSWPLYRRRLSMGLFASVVDLGQLTWARLSNTKDDRVTADVTSQVGFAQVLSPGVYLHVSLGHTPLTAGIGVSYAPTLRKYTFASGSGNMPDVDPLSTIRFGAFLAVDITILPVWVHVGAQ